MTWGVYRRWWGGSACGRKISTAEDAEGGATSMLMPSRSLTGVPSASVADIWEMLLLRGGIVGCGAGMGGEDVRKVSSEMCE